MGSIAVLLAGSMLMAAIQISIFRSSPKFLRVIFAYYTFMGVVCNFLLSGIILIFTGIGNSVGLMNLAGSVVLGIYLFMYKDFRKCQVNFKRVFWIIPKIELLEGNKEPHWLF